MSNISSEYEKNILNIYVYFYILNMFFVYVKMRSMFYVWSFFNLELYTGLIR